MEQERTQEQFALCIENKACEDLEKRKIYQVLPDEDAAKEGYLRIVDESGDDYLYPDFLRRDLPHWKGILKKEHWDLISSRIGWLTYEEIVSTVTSKGGLTGEILEDFKQFFRERSLTGYDI